MIPNRLVQVIEIQKCLPFLGLVIEGGVNTQQPLPRIISIHPEGAAYHNGQLKVGEIIKEVDGVMLQGMLIHNNLFLESFPFNDN